MVHRKRLVTPCFRYTKLRRVHEGKTSERATTTGASFGNFASRDLDNDPVIPADRGSFSKFNVRNVFLVEDYRIINE